MTYETPQQHESRTMPEAFTQMFGNHKRYQTEIPAWLAKRNGIQKLIEEMGIEEYRRQAREDAERAANYWEFENDL